VGTAAVGKEKTAEEEEGAFADAPSLSGGSGFGPSNGDFCCVANDGNEKTG